MDGGENLKKLSEVEKNYLVCALLNALASIGMLLMKKWVIGGVTAGFAVLFVIMGLVTILKNKKSRREGTGKGTGNE